jgi:prolipoprotein diacylglyceryltransferase
MDRSWKDCVRHPMMLRNRFFNVIVSFIIVGCIYYKDASDRPILPTPYADIYNYLGNVQGLLFVSITNVIMGGIFSVALICNNLYN